jgi:two-component system cell cycle sensor histidine kinase/response regulator CckA
MRSAGITRTGQSRDKLRVMSVPETSRLLAFARELQGVATFEELLLATRAELEVALGFKHAWLFVADKDDVEEMRLIDIAGSIRSDAWIVAPVLKIKGDPMLEEIVRSDQPVVVADARTDPRTNQQIVSQLGNRTIVNVPLRLLDKPFGAFGTGTFGDEGCRPPTREELDYLIGMANQLAVAAGRIRFLEERKRSEEALKKTEEQLRHAQKMEAIGRLAGSVAHDFNNLLSVILGHGSFLLEDLKTADPIREEIVAIVAAGERAADLTRQLLAFSRRQVLAPRVLDLNAVVRDSEKMLRRLLRADIELVTRYDRDLVRVKVDPGQVDQIMMNLAVNARDAMPDGGKLTIETRRAVLDDAYASEHFDVTPGLHAMLAVSDTGVGMDKETQARIFEPFFTTKAQGKGTGLGLSTIFGIVKQSGGNIWVYSEPGKGTTFRIYFPSANGTEETVEEITPPTTLRGVETVLVAEDQEQVRHVACEILRRQGYHVLEAQNAGDALLVCERHPLPIHLLVTDVVMPKMNGRELAERLLVVRPDMKVLFMSGYTDNAIVHHGILDPDVAYVQKPLVPDVFARRVREVLDSPKHPALKR